LARDVVIRVGQDELVIPCVDVVWAGNKADGIRPSRSTDSLDMFMAFPNRTTKDPPINYDLYKALQPVYVDQYQMPYNGGLCSFLCSQCGTGQCGSAVL